MKVTLTFILMILSISSFSQIDQNNYKRFEGEIIRVDSITFNFDDEVLIVINTAPEFYCFFELGILYPGLFTIPENGIKSNTYNEESDTTEIEIEVQNGVSFESIFCNDSITISDLRSIGSSRFNHKTKQFSFLLFRKGFANPTEYIVEMYNSQSNNDMDMKTILKGARLIQIKKISLLI